MGNLIPAGVIEQRIFFIRGEKVMIDHDLAELYQVSTKALNQAVRRNIERFPERYMFQLTKEERDELVTNWHRFETLKHSTSYPMAFTEHGVSMLASVLKSKRAVQVSIQIIDTFVELRKMLSEHKELARKLAALEKKYDAQFKVVFDAIRELMQRTTPRATRVIGFLAKGSEGSSPKSRRK